jgi:hypothetical protein
METNQICIANPLKGLCFLSLVNKRRRSFLPSTENFFGGTKVSRLVCDGGSSLLLPINSVDELEEILHKHQNDCTFNIRKGNSPGGSTLSLVLKQRSPSKMFEISLCCDLPLSGNSNITSTTLRYSLSTEDINWILVHAEVGRLFAPNELATLHEEIQAMDHGRRSHGRLGQQILSRFACIKHDGCELYVDPMSYGLPTDFRALDFQVNDLRSQVKTVLPNTFNDWEDDDFAFEDDDYLTDLDDDDLDTTVR